MHMALRNSRLQWKVENTGIVDMRAGIGVDSEVLNKPL